MVVSEFRTLQYYFVGISEEIMKLSIFIWYYYLSKLEKYILEGSKAWKEILVLKSVLV